MNSIRKNVPGPGPITTARTRTEPEPDDIDGVQMLSSSSRPSVFGRVRTCTNVTSTEWLFVIVSSITIGIGFGFTIYRMITLQGDSNDLVFSILVLANLCFSTFYLFHGIFQEQPFEILMLIVTTILLWILIMVNYLSSLTSADESLKLIRFLISSGLTIPMITIGGLVGWRYWVSARLIFKTVGADIRLQTMCKQLYFAYSLLVFDAQSMISAVILILRKGVDVISNEQIFIIVTGAIFTGIWLMLGYTAMRLENMNVTWLFAFCSIVQPAYVLYLLVEVRKLLAFRAIEILLGPSILLSTCIFIASGTLLISHFSLLAVVPIVSFNYGKGLRVKIYGSDDGANNAGRDSTSAIEVRNRNMGGGDGPSQNVAIASSSTSSLRQPLLQTNVAQPQNYYSIA